jgi:AcrR family transcriptional regulator
MPSPEPFVRKRGRPLDTGREHAILQATIELLGERGFDRFTVQDIAERAGAGLGAIYRRWPTKLDVVVAAIRLLEENATVVTPTGDVEHDLGRAIQARVRDLRGCLGAVAPGLVSSMRDNPELAALVQETAVAPRLDMLRAILTPAFPDPVECGLRAEMAMALPVYRLMFAGALPGEREIRDRLVPLILGRPIRTTTGSSRQPGRARRQPARR